uniref:GILT-like protein F37H8.5 n=1 Tax=Rhabditophanes sp. KR3021 TaxID=114890 RepID=A0AC35U574_9BILA
MRAIRYIFTIILFYCLGFVSSLCNLPPDFWCDSVELAVACTGSLKYCESFKRNIYENDQKIDLKVSFEALCPDSIGFVFHRLNPHLFEIKNSYEVVNFEAVPWGLAKRSENGRVKCQHGLKECSINTYLSCSFRYIKSSYDKGVFMNCVLDMAIRRIPLKSVGEICKKKLASVTDTTLSSILQCHNGTEGIQLQSEAEETTKSILNIPKFVPQIIIGSNDKSIDMQFTQLLLKEKIQIWNYTLHNIYPKGQKINNCNTPSEFWCSSDKLSDSCYNPKQCSQYYSSIHNQPLELVIYYDPDTPTTQQFLIETIKKNLLGENDYHNSKMYKLNLVPIWNEYSVDACKKHSTQECKNVAVFDCVSSIAPSKISNDLQICLLEAKFRQLKNAFDALNDDCRTQFLLLPSELRNLFLKCTRDSNHPNLIKKSIQTIKVLKPNAMTKEPWLVLNNHSLHSAQSYLPILHKMICVWYRGENHSRAKCGRCDYEETRC